MKTKEDAIKKAYGKYWGSIKEYVRENGWLDRTYFNTQDCVRYEELSSLGVFQHTHYSMRPKSLEGIENNNGWSVIPSIHDKEIEKGQYWVMYLNAFIEVAYYDGTMECYKFWKLNFTHYQPIEKPKPPIY